MAAKKLLVDMDEVGLGLLMEMMGTSIEFVAAELSVEKPYFVLILFNDPVVAQYITNCERSDVIAALRETADRLKRRDFVDRVPFRR